MRTNQLVACCIACVSCMLPKQYCCSPACGANCDIQYAPESLSGEEPITGEAPRLGVDMPDMDWSKCSYSLGCLRGLVPTGLAPAAAPVKSRRCLLLRRVAWASAAGLMMQQDQREGVCSTSRFQRWHTRGRVVLNHVNLEADILCDAMCKASGEQKPSARAVKSSTRTSSVAASAGDSGRGSASAVTSIGKLPTQT